ncbi:MAG TPA: hypothetical protein VK465_17495 [Fibrobacteria bacterium]|nr:hypothetical protein [Fibrobacteria bacterium]
MSFKSILPAVTTLSLAVGAASALDEYLPVPVRVMQISTGFERSSLSGNYGHDWENDEREVRNNPTAIPIQGKFGVLENLEGSMAARYLIEDSSGNAGLDRPVLALKYADPKTGGGGFLAVSLPVGFEDIMNSGNYATMTFGAMYAREWAHVGLLANASYSYNTEDDQKNKVDNVRLFAKPEYPIPAPFLVARKQRVAATLAGIYEYSFNRVVDSESSEEGGHKFQMVPGLTWTINKIVTVETNAYLTLSGQNTPAAATARALLYFSLVEDVYNAL